MDTHEPARTLHSTDHAAPVVVIGAGPAGLTAGVRLRQAGVGVTVVEATDTVGGISRTVERDGWRFDLGGHRFFTKVPEVEAFWHEVLPDEDFLTRPRMSRILYRGKLFDYPLKPLNALFGLGVPKQHQRAPGRRRRHDLFALSFAGFDASATGDRRQDVDHSVGINHRVEPTDTAYVLPVDEHVDVPTQCPSLIPDAGTELRSRDDGRIQDDPQHRALTADRHDELAEAIGQLAQDPRQDDPHAVTHVSTAARTHRTSGSCSAIRAKLSPSSAEA